MQGLSFPTPQGDFTIRNPVALQERFPVYPSRRQLSQNPTRLTPRPRRTGFAMLKALCGSECESRLIASPLSGWSSGPGLREQAGAMTPARHTARTACEDSSLSHACPSFHCRKVDYGCQCLGFSWYQEFELFHDIFLTRNVDSQSRHAH